MDARIGLIRGGTDAAGSVGEPVETRDRIAAQANGRESDDHRHGQLEDLAGGTRGIAGHLRRHLLHGDQATTDTANETVRNSFQQSNDAIQQAKQEAPPGAKRRLDQAEKLTACLQDAGIDTGAIQDCEAKYGP